MDFICAANWKMNLSFKEAQDFLKEFQEKTKEIDKSQDSILKSPFCIFPQAVQAPLFSEFQNINWGAQDFYFESQGAYTGQNSPELFKELGANIMLIGHSERRTLFNETDEFISQKIKKCFELDLIPMLCIGETLEQRQSNQTLEVIKAQLESALIAFPDSILVEGLPVNLVRQDFYKKMIVAYEPVWAIGTGLSAKPEDVEQVHGFIKEIVGSTTPVLYGGSVKPENAKELSNLPGVNGFLIGGASLKVDSFLAIYQNSNLN